jgi:hypothetical protein
MGNTRERMTCAVRTLSSITSQIFRCQGLDGAPSRADQLGLHDVAWWLLFILAVCAWFLLLFAPQRQRLNNLAEREQVLRGHMQAEKRELARLQRSINALLRNDPFAWERAARGRLGWVEPGEATDAAAWSRSHDTRPAAPNNCAPPAAPLSHPPPPLPKPQIPPLPIAPPALGNARMVVELEPIDPAALGLVRGLPPPLPAAIPPQRVASPAQPHHLAVGQPQPVGPTHPSGVRAPAYVDCRAR